MSEKRRCKWKPNVNARGPDGNIRKIDFPCRYPDKELEFELCNQCLLGELFTMFYAQSMGMKKSMEMQQEMMAFLKNFTSDDWDELK